MGLGLGKSILWLFILIIGAALSGVAQGQPEARFNCSAQNATCRALIGYSNPNGTTLRSIQALFDVKHLPDILGANNLPDNTSGSHMVGPNEEVKVPFPCKCDNGTGLSNHVPQYTIRAGDSLYKIATDVYSGLVKWPQIQEANKIVDANKIITGDKVWIPLPCSCDSVGGSSVVHYAHQVAVGSTVERIADEYGTTQEILLTLNGISDPKSLQAGQILDVPLKACSSNVKNDSLDYPLLVANATYAYTANECVKCKCDSTNNYMLQCNPSQLKPINNWSTCPSTQCSSKVFIGNITSSTDSCNRTICDYAGYNLRNISTILTSESICPAPPPGGGSATPTDSGASRSTLQGWVSNSLLIVIHFILCFVYLL